MGKGRPRKQGKRTASGRLQRDQYPTPLFDRGSDWVQTQRDRFGVHYNSALGRAYAKGLLGEEQEARIRLDAGKRFQRLYGTIMVQGNYRCPLNPDPRSVGQRTAFHEHSGRHGDQDWLFDAMNALDAAKLRPWLDQLLSPEYIDQGPVWLTRILMGGKDPYDRAMLKHAIAALDIIAPEAAPVRIVAMTY